MLVFPISELSGYQKNYDAYNLENSEDIWKSSTVLPFTALSGDRMALGTASYSKQLKVN